MANHSHSPLSFEWVSFVDRESGLRAKLPHHPIEMNIDTPFQNTPPKGQLRLYSTPTSNGLFALSCFTSATFHQSGLEKESLRVFFETILAPYFFFNPSIFKNHQTYDFQFTQSQEEKDTGSFQFTFFDQHTLKRLEGIAQMTDKTLYTAFYIASDTEFDHDVYARFLDSIEFSERF